MMAPRSRRSGCLARHLRYPHKNALARISDVAIRTSCVGTITCCSLGAKDPTQVQARPATAVRDIDALPDRQVILLGVANLRRLSRRGTAPYCSVCQRKCESELCQNCVAYPRNPGATPSLTGTR